jgi:hypothetical protein
LLSLLIFPVKVLTNHIALYRIGARSGKPLTILDREFDTTLPSAYDVFDDNSANATDINQSNHAAEPIYLGFLHLIKLSEILGRILKALYAPKAKYANQNAGIDDPTILLVFDRRLNHWKSVLDAGMFPKGKGDPKPDPEDLNSSEQRNLTINPKQRGM